MLWRFAKRLFIGLSKGFGHRFAMSFVPSFHPFLKLLDSVGFAEQRERHTLNLRRGISLRILDTGV